MMTDIQLVILIGVPTVIAIVFSLVALNQRITDVRNAVNRRIDDLYDWKTRR
jgi:hypothetical protein